MAHLKVCDNEMFTRDKQAYCTVILFIVWDKGGTVLEFTLR